MIPPTLHYFLPCTGPPTLQAAQLVLSEDRQSVTGTKGFRTARASHGAHVGTWYCEVRVTRLGATGHARLGWVTRKAELQAPVGFDQFGYAYRDVEGSSLHQGRCAGMLRAVEIQEMHGA